METDDAEKKAEGAVKTAIAPWLSVRRSLQAVEFYKAAFGADEKFRLEGADGSVVARLAVDGAEFWLGEESPEFQNFSPETIGGGSVRMVFTVADPDAMFAHAVKAGATAVHPVGEQHGWRVGRLMDPFGHHWEIGREV
jgi:PhnB protein